MCAPPRCARAPRCERGSPRVLPLSVRCCLTTTRRPSVLTVAAAPRAPCCFGLSHVLSVAICCDALFRKIMALSTRGWTTEVVGCRSFVWVHTRNSKERCV
ncbi:hypothetical protein C8Q76DRAFT_682578 [Earliella scabrosa]|nr:hypothetical protein C8Q76DRAFT_682578 [Earliella scabrosa]